MLKMRSEYAVGESAKGTLLTTTGSFKLDFFQRYLKQSLLLAIIVQAAVEVQILEC